MFSDAGDGLVELRKLEAAEDIAYQLSQSPNVVYLPPGQNALISLPQHWAQYTHGGLIGF